MAIIMAEDRVAEVETDGDDGEALKALLVSLDVPIYIHLKSPGGGDKFLVPGHADLPWITQDKDVPGWPKIEVKRSGNFVLFGQRPKYGGKDYTLVENNLHLVGTGCSEKLAEYLAGILPPKKVHDVTPKMDTSNVSNRDVMWALATVEGAVGDFARLGEGDGRWQLGNNLGLRLGGVFWALAAQFDGDGQKAYEHVLGRYLWACRENGWLQKKSVERATYTFRRGWIDGLNRPCERPQDGADQKPSRTTPGRSIRLVSVSEIEDDIPVWAWEHERDGRMQLGTLAIFGGRPGAGKSTAARWFAARFSTGTLPGHFSGEPLHVAYITTEESWRYVIKPGLRAVGADMHRIHKVTVESDGTAARLLAKDDERTLTELFVDSEIRVVVVDPLMSATDSKTDIYRNNETREVIEPWARIADRIDGLVIGIGHLVKSPGGDVVAALQGSSAFGEVARAVFGFAKDTEGQRVMSQAKNSTGREDLSLEYEIRSTPVTTDTGKTAEVAEFVITGPSDRHVSDLLRDEGRRGGGRTKDAVKCAEHLTKALSNGPRWATDIENIDNGGFTKDQLRTARKNLDISSIKLKGGKGRAKGRSYWVTLAQKVAGEVPTSPEPEVFS